MSPSASVQQPANSRQPPQFQNASKLNKEDSRSSKAPSPAPTASSPILSSASIQYTVFIRLPFPRNGFEDPPAAEWNSVKDKALWKIISKAGNSREVDWEDMSQRFEVGLGFLLQQAAWLYERHFESMRAQMKRLSVGATGPAEGGSGTSSGVGGLRMERTESGGRGAESRGAAFLSLTNTVVSAEKRDTSTYPQVQTVGLGLDGSPGANSPSRPQFSRTPSTATVTQSRIFAPTTKMHAPLKQETRTSSGSGRRPVFPGTTANVEHYEDAIEHEGPPGTDSEDEPLIVARSQAIRRAPLGTKRLKDVNIRKQSSDTDGDVEPDDDNDDDDDDSADGGGFLPFATVTAKTIAHDNQPATLRGSPGRIPRSAATATIDGHTASITRKSSDPRSTTESSTSSASGLAPRHRAQLASLSPRSRRNGGPGSEDSPSMGSSFSDLDDASVTQSALEEALLSNLRTQGGTAGSSMASRMSSLRDALGRRGN